MKKNLLTKAAAVLLAVMMLSGCGDSESSARAQSFAGSTASAESMTETAESSADSTADSQSEPAKDLARAGTVRDITSMELVAEMKVGWNLGNSLDATSGEGLDAETSWGNPKITKEMIDAVAAKGFNLIRIPVTWDGHFGDGPDYTIDAAWLDRVQEVVNYAYDNDMYILLDSHHEERWRIPDDEHIEEVDKIHRAVWTQIAERFKDYGDHLVFDGLNEPRVKGSKAEWNGGTEAERRCIDRLNQSFVDVVRATGGNNEKRLLLVTTYGCNSEDKTMKDTAVPKDDHIAFSIHAYTPYGFTYHPMTTWELYEWDGSQEGAIDDLFRNLRVNYIKKGIPALITEFGAVNKDGNDAEVAKWVTYYLESAKTSGVPCVWWDNGCYRAGSELFGIFDRRNLSWFSEPVVDAMMKVYEEA